MLLLQSEALREGAGGLQVRRMRALRFFHVIFRLAEVSGGTRVPCLKVVVF